MQPRIRLQLTGLLLSLVVGMSGTVKEPSMPQHRIPMPTRVVSAAATATNAVTDSMTHYLVNKWNLASGYAATVSEAIQHASHVYHLDPTLLMAIAATESGFSHARAVAAQPNPNWPYGIMQLSGRYHSEIFPNGVVVPTSAAENIHLAAHVFREYLDMEHGDEKKAILRYNASKKKEAYYRKVRHFRRRFKVELASALDKTGKLPVKS